LEGLQKTYESAHILDFEIEDGVVELGIEWRNYAPRLNEMDFTMIRIHAEKIWWENVPNLGDSYP